MKNSNENNAAAVASTIKQPMLLMLAVRRLLLPLLFCCGLCLDATIGGQATDPKRDYDFVFENFTCAKPATATVTATEQLTSTLSTTLIKQKQKTAKHLTKAATTADLVVTSVMASGALWHHNQHQYKQQQQKERQPQYNPNQNHNLELNNVVQRLKCGLNKNSKRRTLQMEMSFGRKLQNFDLNVLIILPRKHNDDFVLFNLTGINGCQFLANKNLVTLLQLGRANLNHYSNFPHDCPFLADTVYYVRNYRWAMDTLPAFAIETDVHITFDYVVDGYKIITGFIKARLDLKSSKKDLSQLMQI